MVKLKAQMNHHLPQTYRGGMIDLFQVDLEFISYFIFRITDLSAKIVSQLNGLLFLVDCRKIPRMETNILHQLSTIYSRLQDILIMVEKSKNSSVSLKTDEFTIQNVKSDLESDYSKHSNDADRVFGLNQQRNYATFEMKDQTSFESTEPKVNLHVY